MGAALAMALLLACDAYADSSRIRQFEYDGAGNLVNVTSVVLTAPPLVSDLTPAQVREGGSVVVVASGSNLLGAQVTASSALLAVKVLSSSLTQIEMKVTAAVGVAAGDIPLSFATKLGSDTADITVIAGVAPMLLVLPNPLVVESGGAVTQFSVRLESADVYAHEFSVTVADPAIAGLSTSTLTIPLGSTDTQESIEVFGLAVGATTVQITAATYGTVTIPAFVDEGYVPESGGFVVTSAAVSVVVSGGNNPTGGIFSVSAPVGLVSQVSTVIEQGFGTSPSVGVIAQVDTVSEQGFGTSPSVGVIAQVDTVSEQGFGTSPSVGVIAQVDTVSEQGFGASPSVGVVTQVEQSGNDKFGYSAVSPGVVFGASGRTFLPAGVQVGNSAVITLMGSNLDQVDSIRFDPAADIALVGLPIANGGGTQTDFTIDVGPAAQSGPRTLFLSGPFGEVPVEQLLDLTP